MRLLEAITQKKPNTVSCDADEIDIYSQKESFACQKAHPFHLTLTSPLAVSQLDFAGWPLGQRSKDVSKFARHR